MAVHLGGFRCLSWKLWGNWDLDVAILRLLDELLKQGYLGLQLGSEDPEIMYLVMSTTLDELKSIHQVPPA